MKVFNDDQKLKQFVDLYFNSSDDKFYSMEYISKKINCSIGKVRKYVELFIECEFLYRDNKKIMVYRTKRNFSLSRISCIKQNNVIMFKSRNFIIAFDEYELYEIIPEFHKNKKYTIQEIVFWLFLFTIKYFVIVRKKIYIKQNSIWMQKKCYCNKLKKIIYLCEFTQSKQKLYFYNN